MFRPYLALLLTIIGFAGCQSKAPPKEIANSIGMKLTFISKGSFVMGHQAKEPGAKKEDKPHRVKITNGFYMGTYEVTQEQYELIMGKNPSLYQGERLLENKEIVKKLVPGIVGYNHPVEAVSWNDAVEFCKKLSELPEEKQAGRVYRLPTEAEWEYACRAGSTTAYHCGNSEEYLRQFAWFGDNSGEREVDSSRLFKESNGDLSKYVKRMDENRNTTHPVGQKKPNVWGLYDMHGNVWEWCSDWHGDYPSRDVVDPKGPNVGTERVHRGGCYMVEAATCRSAIRNSDKPDKQYFYAGFRVVMEQGK